MSRFSIDPKEKNKMANERRIDELLNISNRFVRTERFLEQHSDISDAENIANSEELQQERLGLMENLKSIIAYGKHENDEKENLRRKLEFTDGYINHNAYKMDTETLEKTLEKQEHRYEMLDFME